ncbi:amidohydrolase family protein [Bradyrhizobium sp.]|jgi:5-methylthioadenosine/S-adenosylhomocysteine deaminase|uniref:amidohydrolase family protein n=1 Tax=Bradyrhizobium sp. TaxID=376 RepID=UPI002DDCE2D2|nr:amidohydrolase family protein [Bradyrhizobium sp.]HEV2155190.1 amidohydrolase family protein [Bradyrhizobium sp.]
MESATTPRACDLLVNGGLIVTLDGADRMVEGGAVAIEQGRIVDVGDGDELAKRWSPRRTIDARDKLVMPGLVNVHNHTPLMITRGMIEDLGFAPMFTAGIPQGHRLTEGEATALSRLGVYEMLRTGSTTIVDFYRYPEALAKAHAELGSRAVIAGRIHDADPEALTQKRYDYSAAIGAASIAENVALVERWQGHDNGRIRCDFAPHAPDTCSDELLREVAGLVQRYGGNVHTHVCQSPIEVSQTQARSGRSPVEVLDAAGLLDQRLIAAHCIHVTADDEAALGAAKATMAYTPIGNAKTGRIAPAASIARHGARMALCTDTFSGDMFEAMRWAVAMQRIRGEKDGLNARTALRWATQGGAEALGLGDEIGSVTVGKKADLVLLDLSEPTLAPVIDGFGALVWSGNGNNVKTVIVDGRVVIEDGRLLSADGAELVREAQKVAEALWARHNVAPVRQRVAGR